MPLLQATNADLLKRITALESWRSNATLQLSNLSAQIQVLITRVTALEAGGGTDTSALEARLAALETKTCVQAVATDPTSFEARLEVLEADHVPEP